ncbi:MAG: SUMF1/EgtB/PvdO family nonheme iron enzyme, partial [Kiritimatiellaeota bacterium]|nr:SUMF1/EgtB/PvdO family nonheme iron enzyme [Kiritimatiellota bacterium]
KPQGRVFSPPVASGDTATDSDADPATGRTPSIVLAAGASLTDLDAGLAETGSIGDLVWDDANFNGIQDPGENGAQGITVRLLDGAGTSVLATEITDAAGNYLFSNLTPGSYMVEFVAPQGYVFTHPHQGTDPTKDSDADRATGRTPSFNLPEGQNDRTRDAGLAGAVTLTVASDYGTVDPSVGVTTYDAGTEITATAAGSPVAGTTGQRFVLTGWTGTGDVPPFGVRATTGAFTLTQDSTLTWQWQTQWLLTLEVQGRGSVTRTLGATDSASGRLVLQDWYRDGAEVQFQAEPARNYHFVRWTGDLPTATDPTHPILTVTFDRPRSLTALFELDGTFSRTIQALGNATQPTTWFGVAEQPDSQAKDEPPAEGQELYFMDPELGDLAYSIQAPSPDIAWLLVVRLPPTGTGSTRQGYDGIVHLKWGDDVQRPEDGWPTNGLPFMIAEVTSDTDMTMLSGPVNMLENDEWPDPLTADPNAEVFRYFRIFPRTLHRLQIVSAAPGVTPPLEIGDPQGAGVYPAGSTALWSVTSPWPSDTGRRFITYVSGGTVLMDAPKTITVPWQTQWRIDFAVQGPGSLDRASGWYNDGGTIEVTPTAEPHAHFVRWEGDTPTATRTSETLSIPVNGPMALTAVFAWDTQTLTVVSPYGTPALLSVADESIAATGVGDHTFEYGIALTGIVQGSPTAGGPGERFVVLGWRWNADGSELASGLGNRTSSLSMTRDSTLTWLWGRQVRLVLNAVGNGVVLRDPRGIPDSTRDQTTAVWYMTGAVVRLLARPGVGQVFAGWTGAVPPGEEQTNPITLRMDAAAEITADFEPAGSVEIGQVDLQQPQRTLTVLTSGTGSVQTAVLTRSSASTEGRASTVYAHGTTVQLTATAAAGTEFNQWYGDVPTNANVWDPTLIVGMDRDRRIVADFVPTDALDGVHAARPSPGATDVPVYSGLEATLDPAPTPLLRIGNDGNDQEPNGPDYEFLAGRHQVTVAEFIAFLNSVVADAPPRSNRQSGVFPDPATGKLYFNVAQAPSTLLFDPLQNNQNGYFDYGIQYIPDPDGGHFEYDATYRDFPIVGVTWYGAVKYCNWLTARKGLGWAHWCYTEGESPQDWRPANLTVAEWTDGFDEAERRAWLERYPDGFRLPMDGSASAAAAFNEFYKFAAWDGAAGVDRVEGSGGRPNAWDDVDPYNGPVAADDCLPNYFGLDHALGNVWTWMTDTLAPGDLGRRAIRGWSWWNRPEDVDATFRWGVPPEGAYSDLGFRVVTGRDYQVEMQLTDATDFSNRTLQATGPQTARTWYPDLLPAQTYLWRVQATYPGGLLPSTERWFGAMNGQFDPGLDTRIYPNTESWTPVLGTPGIQVGLYFADVNGDGAWQENEAIWADRGRTGRYDPGVDMEVAAGDAGWSSTAGAFGRGNILLFADTDGNGRFDPAEDVWQDNGTPGRYDAGIDILAYDGGDGGQPVDGMPGTNTGLFYEDADGNGAYTPGEDLWRDNPGGVIGEFDDGLDTRVFDGGDGWTAADGAVGTQRGVYYSDTNLDNAYTINAQGHGEDIWIDAGRNGTYDAGLDTMVSAGYDGWQTPDGAAGIRGELRFADTDRDGRRDAAEDVWADRGNAGMYDAGIDVLVRPSTRRDRDGVRVGEPADGETGIHGDLRYADANGDWTYSPGVDNLWVDGNGDAQYSADEQLVLGVWRPMYGTPGTGGRIFYQDTDADGQYTDGEPLWVDRDTRATPGVFDTATDLVLLGTPPADGTTGISTGVFFSDANGNGVYDPDEDVWREAPYASFTTASTGIQQVAIDVTVGWNLISTPLEPIAVDVPPAVAPRFSAWKWNRTAARYEPVSRLEPGRGYWFFADAEAQIIVTGYAPEDPRVFVYPGWNLTGVITPVRNLDPANLYLPIYWWDGTGYVGEDETHAIQLRLFRGYWIKVPDTVSRVELREWEVLERN